MANSICVSLRDLISAPVGVFFHAFPVCRDKPIGIQCDFCTGKTDSTYNALFKAFGITSFQFHKAVFDAGDDAEAVASLIIALVANINQYCARTRIPLNILEPNSSDVQCFHDHIMFVMGYTFRIARENVEVQQLQALDDALSQFNTPAQQ